MEFEKTNENCILAQLSQDDLKTLGLTYEELDYCNEKTRFALKDILSKAKTATHNSHDFSSKIRIDVMPGIPDGCMVLFTDLTAEREKIFFSEPLIFESDCFDNVVDCARTLSSLKITTTQSLLFGEGEKFRLIVSGADDRTAAIISEYMDLCRSDSICVERTKEYMKCLIDKDALKILGKQS